MRGKSPLLRERPVACGDIGIERQADPVGKLANGNRVDDLRAERGCPLPHGPTLRDGVFDRLGEHERAHDVLGTRAHPRLLAAAVDERLDADATAQVERADALERADLVRGERRRVHPALLQVDVELAEPLHGIREELGLVRMRDTRERADGLNRAKLVVDGLHGDERDRAALALDAREQGLERLGAHGARGVWVDLVDGKALGLERLRAVQDGVVLDRRDDDVRALCPGDGLCQPADRRVVRFGTARGKGQLGRSMGAERGRDALARVLELARRRTPLRVERVGICPRGGRHRVSKARVERRGCRIVQIRAPTHGRLGSASWPRPGLPP